MDQTTYERWWQLHLRVARGEMLDEDTQAEYAAGLAVLDQEEHTQWGETDLELLRKLKSEVEALQAAHERLQSRSQHLDRQIWTLEGAYMALTGLELGSQGYVPSPV